MMKDKAQIVFEKQAISSAYIQKALKSDKVRNIKNILSKKKFVDPVLLEMKADSLLLRNDNAVDNRLVKRLLRTYQTKTAEFDKAQYIIEKLRKK